MAEEQTDDSQKTEDPTQRRIDQAREKGQVARSQEINHWFIILAVTLLVTIFAAPMMRGIVQALRRFVEEPHAIRLDGYLLREVLMETAARIGLALMVPFAVVMLAALVAGVIQNGLIISAEAISPKLEKISPAEMIRPKNKPTTHKKRKIRHSGGSIRRAKRGRSHAPRRSIIGSSSWR